MTTHMCDVRYVFGIKCNPHPNYSIGTPDKKAKANLVITDLCRSIVDNVHWQHFYLDRLDVAVAHIDACQSHLTAR